MANRTQPLCLQATPWGVPSRCHVQTDFCHTSFINFNSGRAATAIRTPPFPLLVLLVGSSVSKPSSFNLGLDRSTCSFVTDGSFPKNATGEGGPKRICQPSAQTWALLLALSCFFKSWKRHYRSFNEDSLCSLEKNEGKRAC